MTSLNGAFTDRASLVAPTYGIDLSRSYVPLLLVIGLAVTIATASWTASAYVQEFKAERSAVMKRLDKIEHKLDTVLNGKRTGAPRRPR